MSKTIFWNKMATFVFISSQVLFTKLLMAPRTQCAENAESADKAVNAENAEKVKNAMNAVNCERREHRECQLEGIQGKLS